MGLIILKELQNMFFILRKACKRVKICLIIHHAFTGFMLLSLLWRGGEGMICFFFSSSKTRFSTVC